MMSALARKPRWAVAVTVTVVFAVVAALVVWVAPTSEANPGRLHPLSSNVVVKAKADDGVLTGNPNQSPQGVALGEVIAVGPGDFVNGERIPLDVAEGDTVVFLSSAGVVIGFEGLDLRVLDASEVLAIVG